MTPIFPLLLALALTLALACGRPADAPTTPAPTPEATLAPSALSNDLPPLQPGTPAPAFTLPALDGNEEITLNGLAGNVIVLNFWASWCSPCRREMPDFQKAWEEHRDRGVVFLGIAVDDIATAARSFAQQVGVTYPLAIDPTGDTARAYRLRAVPSTYFIDPQGNLATTLHGLANQGALRIFLRAHTQ